MKIKKAEKSKTGIFDGCVFAVAQGRATFNEKRNIRKVIISNGGVISYLVTKRCNYLILLDEKRPSIGVDSAINSAQKYKIPVVSADFVDKCIQEDRIITATTSFIINVKSSLKKRINNAFNYGKISIATKDEEDIKKSCFTGKFLKVWDYLDPAMPPFYELPYVLAKYTVFKSKTGTNFASAYYATVEIHVKANSTNNDDFEHKYCVFVYSGSNQSDFVRVKDKLIPNQNKSSQTCRFTNDSEVALESYAKILKSLKSPPRSMTICKLIDECIPTFVGSTELQKVIENLNISNDNIDVEVKDMIGHMWKETLGCIGNTSTFDATAYSISNLDEAEKCLIEIYKQDDKKCDEFQDLVKKYINLVPNQKQVDFTVIENINKQRKILKLLRDVVVLSEVNSDGILGAYKALNCRLNFVNKDSLEYASIANTIVENGPKIDLINVFAVRRPIEDENFMFSLNNKKKLFYGSSIENYIGILSRGLLPASDLPELADPENKVGELGNGIYFTDSIKKCLNYSTVNDSRQSRLMLIAEVALGTCYETSSKMPNLTCPPEGYDSVNGLVGPQFKENEFVVYNVSQQRLIYLIEFKMPEDTLSTAFVKTEANFENFWMPKEIAQDVTPMVSLEQILSLKEQNLGSVKWGLLDNNGRSIPLTGVHVRGRILDLAANIVIIQTYYNNCSTTLEEFKFVFPLNDETAVCGFDAFIGEKHVIGEIQEKKKAHAMYKEAVSKGHGGYLMDEQKTETFSITIGNLPPKTSVIIKISYVTELSTEGEHMAFRLPKGITGGRLGRSRWDSINQSKEQSLKIAIEMPFVIKRISSHTNNIQIKKTDTMATVQLVNGDNLSQGFELIIQLAEIHVPRMWVENHPYSDSQACMLTFYPSFDVEEDLTEKSVIIMLDASNSMAGEAFEVAKTIALLCLHKMSSDWNFNVIIYGTVVSEELFPSCQTNNMANATEAKEFIENSTCRMGSSDVYQAMRSLFLMAPPGKRFQDVFLITDGHILSAENVIKAAAANRLKTRIFTFGIGSEKNSCDKHFLNKLAYNSAGAYEEFDLQTKSKWIHKVNSQLQKSSQAVINDVRVEWQQFDENIATFLQAPIKFPPIFHGNRLVVYGFIPNCTLATLKACVNGFEVSTVVSTSNLSTSTGEILHRLAARAIIRDWNQGYQDDNDSKDKFIKISKRWDIINMSKKYNVLSPMTSFVAIEKRNKGDSYVEVDASLLINDLLNNEEVDRLSYIDFDPVLGTDKPTFVLDKEIPVFMMFVEEEWSILDVSNRCSLDNSKEQSRTSYDKSTSPQSQLKYLPTTLGVDPSEWNRKQLAMKAREERESQDRNRNRSISRECEYPSRSRLARMERNSTSSQEHKRSRSRERDHHDFQDSGHRIPQLATNSREERNRTRSREHKRSRSRERDHHDFQDSGHNRSRLGTNSREEQSRTSSRERKRSRSRERDHHEFPDSGHHRSRLATNSREERSRTSSRERKRSRSRERNHHESQLARKEYRYVERSHLILQADCHLVPRFNTSVQAPEVVPDERKLERRRWNDEATGEVISLVPKKNSSSSSSSSVMDIDPPVNYDFNNATCSSSLTVSKSKRSKPPLIILSERGKEIEDLEIVDRKSTFSHLGTIPILTTLKCHLISSESIILDDWVKQVLKKGWGTKDAEFMNFSLLKEFDFWREQLKDGSFDTSPNKEFFIEILDASGIKSLGVTLKTTTIRMCCTLENIIKTFIKLGALLPTTEIDDKTLELKIDQCVEQFLKALGNAHEPLIIRIIVAVVFVIQFTEKYPVLFNNLQLKNYSASNTMFAFSHANWETFILSAAKRIPYIESTVI